MHDDLPPQSPDTPSPASGGDAPPVEIPRVLPWYMRPGWQLALLVLLIVVASPFAYRSSRLAGVPDIGEPFDVAAFVAVKVDPADNAAVDYAAAGALLVTASKSADEQLDKALTGDWADAAVDVRNWLADNAAALDRWREGADKSECLFVQPGVLDYNTPLPHIQDSRTFARLARLRGKELEAAGEWGAAWQQFRAIYRSSRHIGRHGCFINRLVGAAIHSLAVEAIGFWAQQPEVTVEMLDAARREMESDWLLTAPLSEGFKVEYVMANRTFDLPSAELMAIVTSSSRGGSTSGDQAADLFFWINNERELGRRLNAHVCRNFISQVDLPRSSRAIQVTGRCELFDVPPGRSSDLRAAELLSRIDRSWLAGFMLPAFARVIEAIDAEQTRHAALNLLLKLMIHRRRHGEFPEKLTDLDGIDPKSLIDPCSRAGKPINFRCDTRDGSITLWSVGRDGIDDGGDVDDASGRAKDIGFRVPSAQPTTTAPVEASRPPE